MTRADEFGYLPQFVPNLTESDYVTVTSVRAAVFGRHRFGDVGSFAGAGWTPYAEAGLTLGYRLGINVKMEEYSGLETYARAQPRLNPGFTLGTGLQRGNFHVGLRTGLTTVWRRYYDGLRAALLDLSLSSGYRF